MTEESHTDWILRAHLREMPFHRVIIRSIEARILSEVSFPPPVLDVGCGDGHFASVLFPKGTDVGLDPGMAEAVEARSRGVYRLVVRSTSVELPFAAASFHSVLSNCVLEHIPDLDSTLGEVSRVLRPGGLFACTVIGEHFSEFLTDERAWSRWGLGRAREAYLRWFNRKAIHHHFEPPERWRERFARAGLAVRSWRYYLSPKATRVFHWSHYVSLPHLLARRVTGRWVPTPALTDRPFWINRFRRYVAEPEPPAGSCIAFLCERSR